jgi:hypothetical protein
MQLDFPERAAGLLVRQDVLQRQDVARQLFDIRLRLVDGFQPLSATPPGLRAVRVEVPCSASVIWR